MPRAHEAALRVDASFGEVRVEMAAPPRDGEEITLAVPDGPDAFPGNGARRQAGRRTDFMWLRHDTPLSDRESLAVPSMFGHTMPSSWRLNGRSSAALR